MARLLMDPTDGLLMDPADDGLNVVRMMPDRLGLDSHNHQ